MSSSTTSRYREPTGVTTSIRSVDSHNTSFAEEHALDAIAKEVCHFDLVSTLKENDFLFIKAKLRLQHQNEQNRAAREMRYRELERTAGHVSILLTIRVRRQIFSS
jgi:hypothetical protein